MHFLHVQFKLAKDINLFNESSSQYRAVFNSVSKVISRLLWFCITTLCDWLTKLAPLSQPMEIQTKTNCVLVARVFPSLAFGASYMYLLRIVIGSLCCLHLLRLTREITLVLVLRHSIGNRSNTIRVVFI